MHILHLIKTSEGATWALELIKALRNRFSDITFSVVIPEGGKHYKDYQEICKNVYPFDFSIDFKVFLRGRHLREIIRVEKPTIIHSWFVQTTFYSRLFLRDIKIPKIFQVVGPLHLENKLIRYADKLSASKYDYWIATSECIRNYYLQMGVSQHRVFLNYAFINLNELLERVKGSDIRKLRDEFNIPDDVKIIGTASYIYPPKLLKNIGIKGHEFLLDAYQKLLEKRNDVVLVISGTTFGKNKIYENKLIEKANSIKNGRVIFTGGYSNVYSIISNFDAFIYLSLSENLGGVFESLLYKVPTVSSNRGGLPELVINGKTGIALDPRKSEFIAEVIDDLLNNKYPIEEFKENGFNRVVQIFEIDRNVETARKIYQSIIGE
ncbi:glycosyltransferase family 4 protein [Flavihumibacter sp. UBA7668]|uniref:glycosyltransferase family 4 protein n=1 Tax=Flavihumibacter sp. UBA7668 TaxID=1946542 RepID=UPI0025BB5C85|nr:glycosyltransferase family 4 protein [Flavihumibacter sp. UBA7668]